MIVEVHEDSRLIVSSNLQQALPDDSRGGSNRYDNNATDAVDRSDNVADHHQEPVFKFSGQ